MTVYDINDHAAIGSGSSVVIGVLNVLDHLNPKEQIIKAVNIASKVKSSISGPFVYINTKDYEFEIIEEEK